MNTNKAPKILYLLSQFPETHETFITRELQALKEKGWNVPVVSFKPCHDKVIYPASLELMKETYYAGSLFKFQVLINLISALFSHPFFFIHFIYLFTSKQLLEPHNLLKSLYILLKSYAVSGHIHNIKPVHIHAHWATVSATSALILQCRQPQH